MLLASFTFFLAGLAALAIGIFEKWGEFETGRLLFFVFLALAILTLVPALAGTVAMKEPRQPRR